MKRVVFALVMASFGLSASAQSGVSAPFDSIAAPARTDSVVLAALEAESPVMQQSVYIPVFQYWKEHDIFQHLDVSLTLGTTGIGIDVASPIGQYVQLRAGYAYMPHFKKSMRFDMTLKGEPVRQYDALGNRVETNFDKLNSLLYEMYGYEVQDHADMIGKPTISNAKVLVDVFPFKNNKHWHFTAGFYWGSSKFAEAENSTETMISLISAGMYNKMYQKIESGEPWLVITDDMSHTLGGITVDLPDALKNKFLEYGQMGFSVGYYRNRFETDENGNEVFDENGNLIPLRYIVQPGDDGMVRVTAKSNSFKPYLGFGYGGRLLKNDDNWKISFDCGALFWGGTPDLYVHDGTNLTKDVRDINGKVGSYVRLFKAFKVYPVLSIRLTRRIF